MKLIHALAIVLSSEVSSIDPVRVAKQHLRRDLQDEQEQFGADPSTLTLESMSMVSMKIVSSPNVASKASKSSKTKNYFDDLPIGDFNVFWYKPHWQCGGSKGGNPQSTADFINSQMVKADFTGIVEWEAKNVIGPDACRASIDRTGGCDEGGLENYSSIIATTGKYTSPAVLFYNTEKWQLVAGKSLPSAAECRDGTMPVGPYSAKDNRFTCADTPTASDGVCCQGANSPAEPKIEHVSMGRAWVGGLFQSNSDASREVCVIVGELPHSIRTGDTKVNPNVNFPEWATDCTDSQDTLQYCMKNTAGTGIYGTSLLVEGVKTLCGEEAPILIMVDSNIESPEIGTGDIFFPGTSGNRLAELQDPPNPSLRPYTCCNDDPAPSPSDTHYSYDRLAATPELVFEGIVGGSMVQNGKPSIPYPCGTAEEHAPMIAAISFNDEDD